MSAIQTVTDRERDLAERLATAEQRSDELAAQVEVMRHVANEWADAACNGLTWLRNVEDGISSASAAISAMESDIKHARDVGTSAGGQTTSATILSQRDARTLREAADIADQWGDARTDGQGGHALRNYAARIRNMAAELERKNA